jgi:hypothetical protein
MVLVALVAGSVACAQPEVSRATYEHPIAGFSLELPEDWEMGMGDLGNVVIALDADAGPGTCTLFPMLWFFYASAPPQQMAAEIAQALNALDHSSPAVQEGANGEYIVAATSRGPRGAIVEEWHCRQEGGRSYVLASMVKPEFQAQFADDLAHAFRTCRLIPRVPVTLFTEPTENAYRMVLPADWQWSGRIIRTPEIPGYFEWLVASPDGLTGAFSSPPGVFNVMLPYMPAGTAAEEIVLPGLREKLPDARLEAVHELPRPGAYYSGLIRAIGLGANPQVHKVRADYVGTRNGVRVRVRANVATMMLDASPLLGGRGNWTLLTSGYWAPEDQFDELGPVGRSALASLMTDPTFKRNQFEAGNEVAVWSAWNRELSFWRFMLRLWSN